MTTRRTERLLAFGPSPSGRALVSIATKRKPSALYWGPADLAPFESKSEHGDGLPWGLEPERKMLQHITEVERVRCGQVLGLAFQ